MDAFSTKKSKASKASDEVSTGQDLLNKVVELTGLHNDGVYAELEKILQDAGHVGGEITLEELRSAMIAYLESFKPELVSDESGLLGE